VLQNDFAALADRFVIGSWPFYALAVAGVFALRRKQPGVTRPYLTWGYPVVPAVFLLASLGMVVNAIITHPAENGVTFGIILAGLPAYGLWRWWERRRATAS
jgi:APA family basic amino acid/polyamine antiporter